MWCGPYKHADSDCFTRHLPTFQFPFRIDLSYSHYRQHRKSLPHDYKSVVATLPPIPGQVPSATGERRKVGKTIDERSYPDEEAEEAGMECDTVVVDLLSYYNLL